MDSLLKDVEKYDFIRFSVADIYGISRGKVLPIKHALKCLQDGIHVHSTITLWGPKSEIPIFPGVDKLGNVALKADLSTLHEVPTADNSKYKVGEFLCETYWLETGSSQQCCPRAVARKQLDRLDEMGYRLKSAWEMEYCLRHPETHLPVLQDRSHMTQEAFTMYDELFFRLSEEAAKSDIQTESMHSELFAGDFEMALAAEWGIRAADGSFICRELVKELAGRHNPKLQASFITKRDPQCQAGTLGQYNHSIWRKPAEAGTTETNAFYDPKKDNNLSDIALWWLGGLVKHTRALCAFYLPTVNCYRMFSGGFTFTLKSCTWGIENRLASYRVKGWNHDACYIECRPLGAPCNPYLVMAGVIAAGIDGIKNKLEAPPEAFSEAPKLPRTLDEALQALEEDKELVEALGEEFVRWFVTSKRQIDLEKLKTSDPTNEDDEEGWENERELYRNL